MVSDDDEIIMESVNKVNRQGDRIPNIAIVYKAQDHVKLDGHDWQHIQWISRITSCYKIDYLNLYRKFGRDDFLKYLDDYIEENNINILLFLTTYWLEFDIEMLKHLRKRVFIVYWMFDDETIFDTFTKYYGQLADLVVTGDYYSAMKYTQMGIDSIWYITPWDISKYRVLDIEKSIDVSAVGRMDKDNRKELLEYLSKNGISVELYGDGTERGFIGFDEMIRVFNCSKININTTGITTILLTELEPAVHKIRQNKGRIGEIALTKSFCLSEYAPGIEKIFELGKEIEVFHDKEELLQKAKYYLAHEDEREEIAKKGYERALKEFDKDIVIPRVLRNIYNKYEKVDWNKRQKEKIEVYFNDAFKKIYSNFRFQHILHFAMKGRFDLVKQELKIFLVYRKFDVKIFLYYVPGIKSLINPYSLVVKIKHYLMSKIKLFLRKFKSYD